MNHLFNYFTGIVIFCDTLKSASMSQQRNKDITINSPMIIERYATGALSYQQRLTRSANFRAWIRKRFISQMLAPLAACQEPAGKLWQLCKVLYVFEHKAQYILIHTPFTRIVVFWHIRVTYHQLFHSQICCNTATFRIEAIFVKYCYTKLST